MASHRGRFQSILVPLDGSSVAEQAVPVAAALAERARCKLKLVLVHPPLLTIEPGSAYTKLELAMQKADRDYLRSIAAPLRKRLGRLLSTAVLQGFVVPTLARYAREVGADLVVMTTHGRGGIRRAWLGSVTDQMIRTADVPILVVRAADGKRTTPPLEVKEILVPLDGSPLAEAALEPAAAFAALWDAEVSLVQVVHGVSLPSDPLLPFPTGYSDEVTQIRREAAQDYIQDLAERLRESGVRSSGVAVLGNGVAETLLALARPGPISLMVVATHGRGGTRRLVLGSVADKLVRGAEVPLLVVRSTARRAGREQRSNAPAAVTVF